MTDAALSLKLFLYRKVRFLTLLEINHGVASALPIGMSNLPGEEVDLQNPPYVSLERQHEHEFTVTASPDGELWLLVGTDSGFEGLTGI